jgi:acyl-CoA reductase-like NAD-dependent aldehyde dehydrogenase
MNLKERIDLMVRLGEHILAGDELLEAWMSRTYHNNKWFTLENQKDSIEAIAKRFLNRALLEKWTSAYNLEPSEPKSVGLILAGNIPMVGFHDVLSTFIAGHKAQVKLSDKDPFVLIYLFELMAKWSPESKVYFNVVNKLKDFDAVIATGSNNTARYFNSYFAHVPNIIRANRTSVAIIDGEENESDVQALGKDIFRYFGLGCRNVSKLYVPEGYNFQFLLEGLHEFKKIVLNDKYKNNFDYNYALFEINRTPYINNGCLLLLEDTSLHSRIASLHYEFYKDSNDLAAKLSLVKEELQCAVSRKGEGTYIPFGKAQEPELWDYADGVDTLKFLENI